MMPRRYLISMLAGWAVWRVFFAVTWTVREGGTAILPKSAAKRHMINAIMIATASIALGGFLFVWGDGPGQPPEWVTTIPFSVVFGLVLYGALGMVAAAIYSRLRKRRNPPRS